MQKQPSVLVIYTGGTIGMIQNKETLALEPFDFDHLYKHIPVLEGLNCRIESHSFDPLIDSSDMKPAFWLRLAKVIEDNYNRYDGFVVLHGTDTMAYSASMLSFMFENLDKPIIFTGSQLPLGMLRTDGRENFIASLEIASAMENGKSIVPEVAIYFENKLFRANRTIKFNAENFDAFLSGNYPVLAEVGIHIKYNRSVIAKHGEGGLKVHYGLDPNVAILKLFPGISKCVVESVLRIAGLRGVILETYGSGNAPTDQWFIETLKEAIDRGIIILNVTQCKEGAVDIGKYQTSVALGQIGVIGGADITTESALAKMMHLLGSGKENKEIRILLSKSLRGEQGSWIEMA